MINRRRSIYWGTIGFAIFLVLFAVVVPPGRLAAGGMVRAPASLDGMVTISTSADKKLTFITCARNHPALWRRLVRSTLSGAFVVQYGKPTRDSIAHAGEAHIEFLGNLLSIAFADSSKLTFTTAPKVPTSSEHGDVVGSVGLATNSVYGFRTHADFVASRDWTQPQVCGF